MEIFDNFKNDENKERKFWNDERPLAINPDKTLNQNEEKFKKYLNTYSNQKTEIPKGLELEWVEWDEKKTDEQIMEEINLLFSSDQLAYFGIHDPLFLYWSISTNRERPYPSRENWVSFQQKKKKKIHIHNLFLRLL